jgi:hypothetical protein
MKTIALCSLLTLLLATGCNKSTHARIAALEAKVEEQQGEIQLLKTNILAFCEFFKTNIVATETLYAEEQVYVATNMEAMKLQATMGEEERVRLDYLWQTMMPILTNATARRTLNYLVQPQHQVQHQPQFKGGIPAEIYDDIAAGAAKRFPGDYDEQVYIINQQVTAYKQLHP